MLYFERGKENKKPEAETMTIQQAQKLSKAFNDSVYWLDVMVKAGLINKAQAGYIIINNENK
jgi:hypothetical protein